MICARASSLYSCASSPTASGPACTCDTRRRPTRCTRGHMEGSSIAKLRLVQKQMAYTVQRCFLSSTRASSCTRLALHDTCRSMLSSKRAPPPASDSGAKLSDSDAVCSVGAATLLERFGGWSSQALREARPGHESARRGSACVIQASCTRARAHARTSSLHRPLQCGAAWCEMETSAKETRRQQGCGKCVPCCASWPRRRQANQPPKKPLVSHLGNIWGVARV